MTAETAVFNPAGVAMAAITTVIGTTITNNNDISIGSSTIIMMEKS
jgi:hypothetical protein